MIRRIPPGLFLVCLALYLPAQAQTAAGYKVSMRPVTVADAIKMTQIGDRSYLSNFVESGSVVQFSPDGSKFAFVTQKGNLKNDVVEFSLLVFQTATALSSPQQDVVATLASSSNREAIRQVQWLADNETLVFLGEQPGETPQLYKVNMGTKKLQKLTNQSTPIVSYAMSENGQNFLYITEETPQPALSAKMMRHGFFVTTQQWEQMYTNHPLLDARHEIYVKTSKTTSPERVGDVLYLDPSTELSLSPDGEYALLRAYTTSPPAIWHDYQYRGDTEIRSSSACSTDQVALCPDQFYIVDLNKKTIAPLLNVPRVTKKPLGFPLAVWTRQNSVFLVNTLLPLDSVEDQERAARSNHVYSVEVTLPERKIIKASEREEPYQVVFIESDKAKDRITVRTGLSTIGVPLEFIKDGANWKVKEFEEAAQQPHSPLLVSLDQDINSPPKLVAHDHKTGRKVIVLDLNPQFNQLTFGHVEIFKWKLPDGVATEGTLYFPPNYIPGKRYPIVVQTHDERRERFWIDGPYTTAYAAQPLANKGFIVLQMGLVDVYDKVSLDEVYQFLSTAKEGPHYTAMFESAIDELDRRGLIDRSRVGYSGFSRTAYHVLYGLTHSRYRVAAAVSADGVNFGYVGCLYFAQLQESCETMNGGTPYGANLFNWSKEAPTLRLDKIETPLLLQSISAPYSEWEIYSGLRWLKKPVELLNFYPDGEHILVHPQERLLSQGSVADWFCFWLQGEEDPDPGKSEQYKRWRELRKLQEGNKPKERSN